MVSVPSSAKPVVSRVMALRLALVVMPALLLFLIGHSAAKATESWAMGVMAADIAFLLIVALWSSIVPGSRRAYR